jgi:hypothetical protein
VYITIYCGVDFHARKQMICYCDSSTGKINSLELSHTDADHISNFYTQFQGEVVVGLEAGGYSTWFEGIWCRN